MAIEKEDKKGKEKKGSSKGIERSGLKEERMGEDVVIKRVLEAVRSRKEDEEAFEELRRINKEKREEIGEGRSNMIGKELIKECEKEKTVSVERVVKLILEGANLDLQGNGGWTALMRAAWRGHEEFVKMLIKAGANLDLQGNGGWTALVWAAFEGNEGVVKMLIKAGANLDLQNNYGETALMRAADNGNEGVVKMLIKAGANLDLQDNYNYFRWTALMRAAENGHKKVVEVLAKAGADPFIVDNDGKSAYDLARNEEIKEIIRVYMFKKIEKGEEVSNEKMRRRVLEYALEGCDKRAAGIIAKKMLG
ncbi:MAG: ankyrin repeat domain-containing protein [Candidatus Anstonellales archaeon]